MCVENSRIIEVSREINCITLKCKEIISCVHLWRDISYCDCKEVGSNTTVIIGYCESYSVNSIFCIGMRWSK